MKINIIKTLFYALMFVTSTQLLAAYEIKKYNINNAGTLSSSQRFDLQASTAQIDAADPKADIRFQMNTGYWQQNTDLIFKNNFK